MTTVVHPSFYVHNDALLRVFMDLKQYIVKILSRDLVVPALGVIMIPIIKV